MLELTTTIKCDCGQRLRVVITKRHEPTNPHGLTLEYANAPYYKLIVTDGELVKVKDEPVVVYALKCKACLK